MLSFLVGYGARNSRSSALERCAASAEEKKENDGIKIEKSWESLLQGRASLSKPSRLPYYYLVP